MKSNKIDIILRFKVLNIVEYRRIRVQYPLRPPRYSEREKKSKNTFYLEIKNKQKNLRL